MKTKIFVVALPSMKGVADEIASAIGKAFEKSGRCECEDEFDEDEFDDDFDCDDDFDSDCDCDDFDWKRPTMKSWEPCEDFTPRKMRVKKPINGVQPWGVKGTKANKNLKFGAEFAVDEPRREDYRCRSKFESDHKAYDTFVTAGEDCVARGLARPEGVTAHKCNGIRKPIGCPPPMNLDLIGESHWFDEKFEW